jgi:PD-(D/E)XK nuclease superfamily
MDPFVHQLKGLRAAHPTRSKWVFVPTHTRGRTLGDRLVLEGTNWANLRFVTPLDIALRMSAPFLVERGIEPSEEELGPALMMRLLLDLSPDGGYEEASFAVRSEADGVPQVLTGVIDLVHRSPEGWQVVDYKADRDGAASLPAKYAEQIAQYEAAWRTFVSEQVTSMLVSTRTEVADQ